ncbi:hypothetical protein T484DRAFT_1773377 [Baffinella frigidus]|nr:hypothetical protein T484DRAFT_1773377 [Cryptophyta sp. CCMP2293]
MKTAGVQNSSAQVKLPLSLATLTALTEIRTEGNPLVKLPLSLATLTALTELRTEGNPLVSPPDEVIQLGAAKVVRYLGEKRSLITENVRDLYSAFDEDGSGSVSRKEMVMGLFKVSLGASKEDLLKTTPDPEAHTSF